MLCRLFELILGYHTPKRVENKKKGDLRCYRSIFGYSIDTFTPFIGFANGAVTVSSPFLKVAFALFGWTS